MYCTICEQDLDHNCQCGTNATKWLGDAVQQCEKCHNVPYDHEVYDGKLKGWLLCEGCLVEYEQSPERAWEGSL